jgi:hypothetical protein
LPEQVVGPSWYDLRPAGVVLAQVTMLHWFAPARSVPVVHVGPTGATSPSMS